MVPIFTKVLGTDKQGKKYDFVFVLWLEVVAGTEQ